MIEVSVTEMLLFAAWGLTVAYASHKAVQADQYRKRARMAEALIHAIMEDEEVRDNLVNSYQATFGAAK